MAPEDTSISLHSGQNARHAGRLAEAEQAFRTSIEKGQIRAALEQAFAWSAWVRFYWNGVDRKRPHRLSRQPPKSTRNTPDLTADLPRCGCAKEEPQRALLLVDEALELHENNVRTRNLDRHNLANMHANRAQALALLGRKEDALSAIETASRVGDPVFIPGLAGHVGVAGGFPDTG